MNSLNFDTDLLIDADVRSRVWKAGHSSPVPLGSEAHKVLFCRMLLETFNPYKPAIIDWPTLTDDERDRLTSLPIWDIAVQTEGRARLRVLSYAEMVKDPQLREAIELDAFEEGRHKAVLSNLVAAYSIALQPEPAYLRPRYPEWAFVKIGYSECIDSFFAFGLFASAKRSGFFPPALVDAFEPVVQEESRHILFFVNWVAWHRRNLPQWQQPLFALKIFAVWSVLLWERLVLALTLGGSANDTNFTANGAKSVGVSLEVGDFLDLCLAENDRRMSGYDPRLLRPLLVPRMIRLMRRLMKVVSRG